MKLDGEARISEVKLYIDRSRGDAGFQYGLRGSDTMAFPQAGWLGALPAAQRASRQELLAAGATIFNGKLTSPPIADDCVMMENGQISNENPEVLKYLMPSDVAMASIRKDARGQALVPCAAPPERPADEHAQVSVVDEEGGIVAATATISGIDQPYLVEDPTTSAFVPYQIMQPYLDVLKAQDETGAFTTPRVKGWPVTATVTELYRVYGGKIHAMLLLFNMQPYGVLSPRLSTPQGKDSK